MEKNLVSTIYALKHDNSRVYTPSRILAVFSNSWKLTSNQSCELGLIDSGSGIQLPDFTGKWDESEIVMPQNSLAIGIGKVTLKPMLNQNSIKGLVELTNFLLGADPDIPNKRNNVYTWQAHYNNHSALIFTHKSQNLDDIAKEVPVYTAGDFQ